MIQHGGGRLVTPPRATYRLQLSPEFSIAAARDLVSYLDHLGISHVFSSPLLRGSRGSTHRYHVVDPTMIDPDIGTEQDLRELAATLHAHHMGLILEMAPDHLAATHESPPWDDVLAHGPSSPFACWFDIDWGYPRSAGTAQLVLPILGESRSHAIARGQLTLGYKGGSFRVRYLHHSFPVDPATIPWILAMGTRDLSKDLARDQVDVQELMAIMRTLRNLPPRTTPDPTLRLRRRSESEAALTQLAALCERSMPVRSQVDRAVAAFTEARGHGKLQLFLEKQGYRLGDRRQEAHYVNYRRFCDANNLVGVCVEDPTVLEETHAHVLGWVADGLIDGLGIDHVDGLLDPLSYLERLRSALARAQSQLSDFPIYVEKVLDRSEQLPECWPVEGVTGHDFLNDLEAVFVAPEGIAAIETWYRRMTAPWRRKSDFATMVVAAKRRCLEGELAADVERLTRQLRTISRHDPRAAGLPAGDLRTAAVEVIACLPVYRTYVDDRKVPLEEFDRTIIDLATAAARRHRRARPEALALLRRVLLQEGTVGSPASEARDELIFVQRFQQISGASTAKGLEGTALHSWIPLLSLNDVGGRPDRPLSDATMAFHLANRDRERSWPGALIATTKSDTKRSGDVRARLDVLSEIPGIWTTRVKRWRRLNRRHRRWHRGRLAPDANTEYLLYQTLVGIWPLPERGKSPGTIPGADALGSLRERVRIYMRTAAREAKAKTSWTNPSRIFEGILDDFVCALIDTGASGEGQDFLCDVARLVARISRPGLWNALGRTLVHLTAPGVPDIYQGDELWNFCLVDPDNRRPVDFEHRRALLRSLEVDGKQDGLSLPLARELAEWPEDGRIKLWVISRTLGLRRDDPTLFSLGDYAPIRVEGARASHVLTFMRRQNDRTALIVVPRLFTSLVDSPERPPLGAEVWRDTCLRLPAHLRGSALRNVLTNCTHVPKGTRSAEFLRVADVLDTLPVALVVAE